MAKMEFAKITSVKFGQVMADGTMQTTLSELGVIKKGTATLNFAEPDITDIEIEESDTPYASKKGTGEKDLTMTLLGIETSNLATLLGGTYSAATASAPEQIAMPSSTNDVLRAVQLEGKNADGENVVIALVKTNVIVSTSDAITKDDVAGWTVKCKILQPVDGSGIPTAPYFFKAGSPTT